MNADDSCPLCATNTDAIWHNDELRVIDACHPDYPGYTRVIWNAHVTEMTDLQPAEQQRLMQVVWVVEHTLRAALAPTKINLAEFGNQVPHLHWHVIPRWQNDLNFPDAIWAGSGSESGRLHSWALMEEGLLSRVPGYQAALREALMTL